ncbi:MAG: hypothetical protein A3F40_02420 [Chlamydiae bacterium RIFCSPHIGHO2_12_FULL_27_8]|nr:MAG: hypothetical protein A3F40_02420 [Chlamydiae bacterium RIFCSPHIGHO2_12_FULL_27_8]
MFIKKEISDIQHIKEEVFNAITHGIGFFLSILAFIFLLSASVKYGSVKHIVSSSIYASTLLLLYINSTLYHSITNLTAKEVFRRLDHISIYFLIAGTSLPVALIVLQGALSWIILSLEIGLCLIGTVFKAVFGAKLAKISTAFYILMGWIVIIAIKPIFSALGFAGVKWIFFGGVFYTFGVVFFATDQKFLFHHAIWHIFVLMGSICHFFFVYNYIIPFQV